MPESMPDADARSGLSMADARAIDALLHGGLRLLRFPPALEFRFQTDTARERLQTLLAAGALVSVLFNWLLLSDWMMIPDRFEEALQLRLMWFTPGILLGLIVLAKLKSPLMREGSLVLAGVVSAALNRHLWTHCGDSIA